MHKKYMVVKATARKIVGVEARGEEMNFGKHTGAFEVTDEGVAAEIDARYGAKGTRDVVVVPHERPRESGHHYVFTVPELPWKRKENQNEPSD